MMHWYGNGATSGWGWALMAFGMIVFWGVLITVCIGGYRRSARDVQSQGSMTGAGPDPEQALAESFARGEISEREYATRLAALHEAARS